MPDSAVSGPTAFPTDPDRDCRLTLRPLDEGSEVPERSFEAPAGSGVRLVVDPGDLAPGKQYFWEIDQDDGTGDLPVVATGLLRTLSAGEQAQLRLSGAGEPGPATRIELGLWNDLLLDLWPRLGDEATTLSERMLARRIIQAAYDWAREYTPGLGTVACTVKPAARISILPPFEG